MRPGCVFLVTSFAQAKEVTRPARAKKGFSKPGKKPVNNPIFHLHSHAKRGNEKQITVNNQISKAGYRLTPV
jgi:hypothetical protein